MPSGVYVRSAKTKKRISKAMFKNWNNPKYRTRQIKAQSGIKPKKHKSERLSDRLCKCGCGERVKDYIRFDGTVIHRKFIRFHNVSASVSSEVKSVRMKRQWRYNRDKMMEGMAKRSDDPNWIKNNLKAMNALHDRPDYSEMLSKALLGRKQPKSVRDAVMIDWQDPVKRSKRLAAMVIGWDKTPNSCETIVMSVLDELGIRYIAQGIVAGFIPDFILPKFKVIIECDGIYWHSRVDQRKRDWIKDNAYKRHCYKVLRIEFGSMKSLAAKVKKRNSVRRLICQCIK